MVNLPRNQLDYEANYAPLTGQLARRKTIGVNGKYIVDMVFKETDAPNAPLEHAVNLSDVSTNFVSNEYRRWAGYGEVGMAGMAGMGSIGRTFWH